MSRRLTAALLIASYHHELAMDNLAEIELQEYEQLSLESLCEFEGLSEFDYWEQYCEDQRRQRELDAEFGDCFRDDLPNFRDVSDDELSDVDHDWDELGGEAGAA